MTHKLIINTKAYQEAVDIAAPSFIEHLDEVSTPDGVDLVLAVSPVDLHLADTTSHDVVAQHVDPVGYGSHTAHLPPRSAERLGATGTLLNHSEHQIPLGEVDDALELAEALGMTTYACADSLAKVRDIAQLGPDYVAIEPPELIGGSTSVSTAKPELIEQAVDIAADHNVPVLCGAGVKTKEDVRRAVELGARGVLVASGVAKADNPAAAAKELLKGFP